MKVLFIANGIGISDGNSGVSGGDIRWIEIAKEWQKMDLEIHVLTQDAGIELCKRLGLKAEFHNIRSSIGYSIMSYIDRAIRSFKIPKKLENFDGVIYATTEHWYDVIPGALIKRKNKKNKFAVVAHWVAPLRRKGTSLLNSFLFYINQRVGYIFAKKYADVILAVSQPTKKVIIHKVRIPENKIKTVECGVHYNEIRRVTLQERKKEYDAVFMKRFDGTKGVFDVIEIWKRVTSEIPNANLVLIGSGSKETINKLNNMITSLGLRNNVKILGPIYDFNKKFRILASSKVFLLPSYEENWAIVIGEAMATGLPVVCYNLPEIQPIWEDNVIWVPKGNKEEFAKKVIELLQNDELRKRIGEKGVEFVKKYDWKEIVQRELRLIEKCIR